MPAYDLSSPAVQDWWLESVKSVCKSDCIDGVFVDGNIKALEPGYLKKQIGAQKKEAVTQGYHSIMKRLPDSIGSDKFGYCKHSPGTFSKGRP